MLDRDKKCIFILFAQSPARQIRLTVRAYIHCFVKLLWFVGHQGHYQGFYNKILSLMYITLNMISMVFLS